MRTFVSGVIQTHPRRSFARRHASLSQSSNWPGERDWGSSATQPQQLTAESSPERPSRPKLVPRKGRGGCRASAATYRHLPALLAAEPHVWRSSSRPTSLGAHFKVLNNTSKSKVQWSSKNSSSAQNANRDLREFIPRRVQTRAAIIRVETRCLR